VWQGGVAASAGGKVDSIAWRRERVLIAVFRHNVIMVAMTGAPQCGHVRAWSLTCPLHSWHLMRAMILDSCLARVLHIQFANANP
jgi:hypothetical protein